jgi:UDP-N-acetylglucosamine--N-acetylmuramyl-(pentapeptide) pyrophosphoryl-undecaprenol N-acetylglucosamine transferase
VEAGGVKIEEASTNNSAVGEQPFVKPASAGRVITTEPVRVLMVAGGTGGHIFPALAVAEALCARGQGPGEDRSESASRRYQVEFLGTRRGLESRLIAAAGFALRTISGAGLKGIDGLRRIRNFLVLPRSAVETAMVLRDFQPDVVLGMGGYIAGPAMLEAALKGIPTLLIESNAVPGFTNRILAPVVRVAAVAFEEAARFYGAKARVTGHPVRKAFCEIAPKQHVPPYTVLIFGGSQGSVAINACTVKSLALLLPDAARWKIIHQTGERDYNEVGKAYQGYGISAEVHTFIEDMPAAFARADVVVSRAGATAVAELAAAGKAALLIPFPAATDQHQLENARTLERAGAARVLEQAELTPERLVRELRELLGDAERLAAMEQAAKRFARPDASERIADLIESLALGTP